MPVLARRLSFLIHADSKIGKSWLADTAPAPRLCLDAEGGIDWTPSLKTEWDPTTQPPPVYDGTWETCVVRVKNFMTIEYVGQWLASGQHPFKSVSMDSVSEVQQRCIDAIAGADQMSTPNWGELLRKMTKLLREFRDYTLHPINSLEAVTIVAMSKQDQNGKWRPDAQGALFNKMPYYFDLIGYLFIQTMDDGTKLRRLLCSPHQMYEAGERLGGRLPEVVDNPNITKMLDMMYGAPQLTTQNTGDGTQ